MDDETRDLLYAIVIIVLNIGVVLIFGNTKLPDTLFGFVSFFFVLEGTIVVISTIICFIIDVVF